MVKNLTAAALSFVLINADLSAQTKSISGFSEKNAATQVVLEGRFDQLLSAVAIGNTIKELSAYPHALGSTGSKMVAEQVLAKFKEWGIDAKIETYQVLFPTPKTRLLEMTAPTTFKALLKEPAYKRRCDFWSARPVAHLQRLERRWRRNRPTCICKLRPARRL